MNSSWPEIPRADLSIGRHQIVDTRTGELFTVVRGVVDYVQYTPVCAYFVAKDGDVVFLERPSGARTVDELAAQREKREQARAERLRPRSRR